MEFAQGRRRYNFCEIMDEKNDSAKQWDGHPASAAAAAEAPSPSAQVEKEHMFDKVVTPSDVGKLNRLVIPKQHAEKYFPLDTTTHEKGLLLDFEDRTGKPWRFRYSYWNSSQSYVMTKGWSRFVKEKRLGAGDTVSFGRGVDDKDRLYIDWKRRPEIQEPLWSAMTPRIPLPFPPPSNYPMLSYATRSVGPLPGRLLVPPTAVYDGHRQNYVYNAAGGCCGSAAGGGRYLVFRSEVAPPPQSAVQQFGSGGFGGEQDARLGSPKVLSSVPVVERQAAAKRVRLFGVNLDCPDTTTTSDGDSSNRSAVFSSPSPSPKGKEMEELSLDLDM